MDTNALIVDDSRLACKIMANMLESLNIKTLAVYSAEDALEYLKHNIPDIIFLDHIMPGMNGLEMIKLIKSNPLTATVPVLMYTAKQGDVYVSQARALGAVDVLPKGMEKNYLVKALTKLGFIDDKKTDAAAKTEEPTDVIQRQDQAEQKTEQVVNRESDLRAFWEEEAEPFLFNQRKMQSADIKYSNRQQTLTLKREIHQIFEQFEHALTGHIEAHKDFRNLKDKIEKYKSRRSFYLFASVLVLLQLGIFWYLFKENQLTEQLVVSIQEQQQKMAQLDQQLSDIARHTQMTRQQPTPEPESVNQKVSEVPFQSISLVNNFGEIIADNLYLNDSDKEEYIGTTVSGYQFIVNATGQVGWPLEMRYYLTNDCTGNVFVESENAKVYHSDNSEIWYVDKLALVTEVVIGSTLNALNECLPADDEVMNLRPLERDYQFETGIDGSAGLKLSFGN